MKRSPAVTELCPCGSARPYSECCAPYLAGSAIPADAESLMRSRYSAYVKENAAYLMATWHPKTRPTEIDFEPGVKWLGLAVKHHEVTGDGTARVAFVARYKIAGRAYRLDEDSLFRFEAGRWYYVSGNSG